MNDAKLKEKYLHYGIGGHWERNYSNYLLQIPGMLPFRHKVLLSKEQCPKTFEDEQRMKAVPYTLQQEA